MAGNSLTPLVSREQYRALYLDNLQSQSAINAFNLNANIEWAASGDTEQEAALAATLQSMSKAQIASEADAYVRALVIARDVQFVLGRLTFDQKKFIILNYAKIAGQMARLNIARPAAGPIFLEVLYSLYTPIKTDNSADILANQAKQVAEVAVQVGAQDGSNVTQLPQLNIDPTSFTSASRETRADTITTGNVAPPNSTVSSSSSVPSNIALSRITNDDRLSYIVGDELDSLPSTQQARSLYSAIATPAGNRLLQPNRFGHYDERGEIGMSPQQLDTIARFNQLQSVLRSPTDEDDFSDDDVSTITSMRNADASALSAQGIIADTHQRLTSNNPLTPANDDMISAIMHTAGDGSTVSDMNDILELLEETHDDLSRGDAIGPVLDVGRRHGGARASLTPGNSFNSSLNTTISAPPDPYAEIEQARQRGWIGGRPPPPPGPGPPPPLQRKRVYNRPARKKQQETPRTLAEQLLAGREQLRSPVATERTTPLTPMEIAMQNMRRNMGYAFEENGDNDSRSVDWSTGSGIRRRKAPKARKSTAKRRMYLAGAGVASAGPKAADHGWQKFGKYILARNDLENGDRVHIRYSNGQPIRRIPVKIAGSGVKAILSSIADKKRPSPAALKKLTDDEREYVQSLIKTASIAPSEISSTKSDKEQMKHEFEKMKGQIVAGNDSPELIKKFKQTIKAMQQNKLLPSASVSEILHELSTLGH